MIRYIALAAGVMLFGGGVILGGVYNDGVSHEEGVFAAHKRIGNAVSNAEISVAGVAGVTTQYAKDFMHAASSVGLRPDGLVALFEKYPEIPPNTYEQLQRVIEAGSRTVRDENTALTQAQREYRMALGSFPTGGVLRWFGFPKNHEDLPCDGCRTVLDLPVMWDDATHEAMREGRWNPHPVFGGE
jgi:hypothetical protein